MALPLRAQPFVTRFLTSERFEKLQRRTAHAVHKLGGQDAVLRFFHDPGCAKSWLMVQALLAFQEKYDVTIIPHTMPAPPAEYVRDVCAYRIHSLRDAQHQARYYGLLSPERAPDPGEVTTVAMELASLEGQPDWLLHAGHLGNALFRGTSVPVSMGNIDALDRNMQLARQLGNYRGATIFAHGAWYFGVDRFARMEEAFAALGAGTGRTLDPQPHALPTIEGDTLRFFFSFRSPYAYLSLQRAIALAEQRSLKLELLPVLAPEHERRPAPLRRQLDLLMDAGREARQIGLQFGRVVPLSQQAHEQLAAIFYGLRNDERRQRTFLQNALHGLWIRGLDLEQPRSLQRIYRDAKLTDEEAQRFLQDRDWLESAYANGVYLEDQGYLDVPAFEIGSTLYWGYDRLDQLEHQL